MTDELRRHHPWRSSFVMHERRVIGEVWPKFILVEHWQENSLGERRLAGTRVYLPDGSVETAKPPEDDGA